MKVAIIAIGFILICCGFGVLIGWLDERVWDAPERAFKSFMREWVKKNK